MFRKIFVIRNISGAFANYVARDAVSPAFIFAYGEGTYALIADVDQASIWTEHDQAEAFLIAIFNEGVAPAGVYEVAPIYKKFE